MSGEGANLPEQSAVDDGSGKVGRSLPFDAEGIAQAIVAAGQRGRDEMDGWHLRE